MITTARECEILPTEFQPKDIDSFVGPARAVARRLENSAKMCGARGVPASHLLVGPSGSGKTALARFALSVFGVQPWTLVEAFGASLDMEKAEEIAAQMMGTSLFGGYTGYLLDEFDNATKAARDHALKFIGEGQRKWTIVVATSNLSPEAFDALEKTEDEKGCLTSRFQVHFVGAPTATDVEPLVKRWLPVSEAKKIVTAAATGRNGKANQPINVRGLLRDVTSWMQR